MTDLPTIVVTVNSPGEVSTWLKPTVARLRHQGGDRFRLAVLITPCVYASGTEERVLRRINGIDVVLTPRQSFSFALFGKQPPEFLPSRSGVLLHLGGEFALSSRMARRLNYRAFAYSEGYINNVSSFETVFTPYADYAERLIERGCSRDQVKVVGNLMVDAARLGAKGDETQGADFAAEARERLGIASHQRVVTLLPGSRPHELLRAIPLLFEAASIIQKQVSDVRFVFSLSPFADESTITAALNQVKSPPQDVIMWRGRSQVAMGASDLALTIPGSTTAELAAWGVPTIVCLPLDRPSDIPLDGILGYVDRIPVLGKRIKAAAVLKTAKRTQFVSLPNRIAGEALIPELKSEKLQPYEIAHLAQEMLKDEAGRQRLSTKLIDVMGTPGAATAISSELLGHLLAGKVVDGEVRT